MSHASASVEVSVPVDVVFAQWTRNEELPRFFDAVHSITRLKDSETVWVVKLASLDWEYEATITEQIPNEQIRWSSSEGDVTHGGIVTFEEVDTETSRVTVDVDWKPRDLVEKIGATFHLDDDLIRVNLQSFKRHMEESPSA